MYIYDRYFFILYLMYIKQNVHIVLHTCIEMYTFHEKERDYCRMIHRHYIVILYNIVLSSCLHILPLYEHMSYPCPNIGPFMYSCLLTSGLKSQRNFTIKDQTFQSKLKLAFLGFNNIIALADF